MDKRTPLLVVLTCEVLEETGTCEDMESYEELLYEDNILLRCAFDDAEFLRYCLALRPL